ncbi:MAG TPA: GlsB/YeaQ/YmgE family stress response membrane protein [Acholeplasmatales bacterium]|nr:GlsB/YeaQ/YmgE family stress response membrane protein [Acholeplasmatales bacterium]
MIILLWIVFGAIVGWIASLITRDNARMGILANILVGLIGSALGGWFASLINVAPLNSFSFGGFMFAVIGAVALLSILSIFRGNRNRN